ncbi:NIPSNAP family protein [Rhodococcus jostii]|uniref:NIPSNAP protein n=1 Tax=Rhodococcus jostii TaxID=132919 RepID=A0A1H4U000_RHOJO|nr:NIPSNAP family protein [Rhodococcus jostii]SEC62007.1 NIPSNAP protein [Rhodococcus jostii]
MIHELREYVAIPDRAEDLHRRFADDTLTLFAELGLQVDGFWHETGNRARIVYLVAFPDAEAATAFWARFQADPRWLTLKARTESDGPLISEIRSTFLVTPAYVRP